MLKLYQAKMNTNTTNISLFELLSARNPLNLCSCYSEWRLHYLWYTFTFKAEGRALLCSIVITWLTWIAAMRKSSSRLQCINFSNVWQHNHLSKNNHVLVMTDKTKALVRFLRQTAHLENERCKWNQCWKINPQGSYHMLSVYCKWKRKLIEKEPDITEATSL